jgi:hypothetical protein
MAAMVLRYVLTMTLVPELRWFGHTIPIFFHFALASYMLTLGLASPGKSSGADRFREAGEKENSISG